MSVFIDAYNNIIIGLPLTIKITLSSIFGALILAIIFTKLKVCGNYIARKFVDLYILLFTGTPLLFQLFIIYFGPAQFEFIRNSVLFPIISDPFFNVFIVFSLNSGAYSTMIFSGAYNNLKKGMWEAPSSMGLTRSQSFNLLLPYVIRISLPGFSNEVILLFKSTSLVMAVTLTDILGAARSYYAMTYDAIVAFSVAGAIYLVLAFIISLIFRLIERYWLPKAVNQKKYL